MTAQLSHVREAHVLKTLVMGGTHSKGVTSAVRQNIMDRTFVKKKKMSNKPRQKFRVFDKGVRILHGSSTSNPLYFL